MSKQKLPRGIQRRGNSLIAVFALKNGMIERRAIGLYGVIDLDYAKEQRAIWQRQVRDGTYEKRQPRQPEPQPETPITVADLFPLYLEHYKNEGGRDVGRQQIAWNNLEPTFGAQPVSDVSTTLILKYIAVRRSKGISNGTINRELSVLQAMFNRGRRTTTATPEGAKVMVDKLPAFPEKLEEGPARQGFVTQEQYEALKANAKTVWMRGFIECAYAFGNRKSELLTLLVSDLDLLDRWIYIRGENTKNGKPRALKMTAAVYAALCECVKGKKETDFVFTRDGSRVVDPRKEWYALCVSSKLGVLVPAQKKDGPEYQKYVGLGMHSFRRSAIRNMTRRGLSTAIAMKVSGHTTRSTFDRYNIVEEQDLQHATEVIERGAPVQAAQTDTKSDTSTYEHRQ